MSNGHQNHGGHHSHPGGALPANPPSSLVSWSAAMNGRRDNEWLKLFNANKMRLLWVSVIGLVLVMWLFFIDYSNKTDRAARTSNRQPNAESSKVQPMQLSATPVIPSSFGAPRTPSDNFQPSPDQTSFGTPTFSQPAGGSYPSFTSVAPSQSFGTPESRFGQPQQNITSTHKPEPYRMVVTR